MPLFLAGADQAAIDYDYFDAARALFQGRLAVDVINIMAFDYGSAIDNGGKEALDAMDAAQATESQIGAAGLSATVGITVMVGVNDVNPEVFHLSDVQPVLQFANSTGYVSRLSLWSISRDNGTCAGNNYASASCSGLTQTPFEFTQMFESY